MVQFIEPAWWLLTPLALLVWIFFRRRACACWLLLAWLLIAALSEPVFLKSDIAENGSIKVVQKESIAPLRYLGMQVPDNLREGDNFSARVFLESSTSGNGNIRLFQDGILVAERKFELPGGRRELIFPGLIAEGALLTLESWIEFVPSETTEDFQKHNPREVFEIQAQSFHAVSGALDVVVVQNRPSSEVRYLRTEDTTGIRFRFLGEEELRANPTGLFPADIILLEDARFWDWPDALWSDLSEWVVNRGGSIVQCGGPLLAAESLENNVRAQLFPLQFQPPEEEEDARAVLVVLDRSGSMGQKVSDVTKMALANEGTLRVASALRRGDWFGVLAVDVSPIWIVPMAPWRDTPEMQNSIRSISPGGGGIFIDTAMRESWNQLRNAIPKQRHLLLFADADDVEEKSEGEMGASVEGRSTLDLASLMRADQISISVVALGFENDKDTPWLRELAGRGRGRFHRTEDARQLPDLFTLEADEAGLTRRSEVPFFVSPTVLGYPLFRDIDWGQSPPLFDQNIATSRPEAEVWMEGKDGMPLLAYWARGLGQVVSWATSWQGGWSAEWGEWEDAEKFRGALLRWLAPVSHQENWEVRIEENASQELLITLRWLHEAEIPPALPPQISVTAADGTPLQADLHLIGVGHWQGHVPKASQPILLEGIAGGNDRIPLTIWNPSQIPASQYEQEMQPVAWRRPIHLRPWILALAVVWLALTGPFSLRRH